MFPTWFLPNGLIGIQSGFFLKNHFYSFWYKSWFFETLLELLSRLDISGRLPKHNIKINFYKTSQARDKKKYIFFPNSFFFGIIFFFEILTAVSFFEQKCLCADIWSFLPLPVRVKNFSENFPGLVFGVESISSSPSGSKIKNFHLPFLS